MSLPVDVILEIAKYNGHADALNLLSMDRYTYESCKTERDRRLRRLRFEEMRSRVTPGIARKYASFLVEIGCVFFFWIDKKHLCRGVITPTHVYLTTYRNVKFIRSMALRNFFHLYSECGTITEVNLETHVSSDEQDSCGGCMCIPSEVVALFENNRV
jgi:hypothetical protein